MWLRDHSQSSRCTVSAKPVAFRYRTCHLVQYQRERNRFNPTEIESCLLPGSTEMRSWWNRDTCVCKDMKYPLLKPRMEDTVPWLRREKSELWGKKNEVRQDLPAAWSKELSFHTRRSSSSKLRCEPVCSLQGGSHSCALVGDVCQVFSEMRLPIGWIC